MPQLAPASTEHASKLPPGCTDMTNESLCSTDTTSRLVQLPELHRQYSQYTGAHHNPSHSFTPMENETVDPMQQQHHTATLQRPLQQFDKDFRIMQQQIQARHITLDAQIQAFLALFGPRHDNPSQTELSPPERKPTIDAMYS